MFTIMLITLINGDTVRLKFPDTASCGAALLHVDEAAATLGVEVITAQCLAASIIPKARP